MLEQFTWLSHETLANRIDKFLLPKRLAWCTYSELIENYNIWTIVWPLDFRRIECENRGHSILILSTNNVCNPSICTRYQYTVIIFSIIRTNTDLKKGSKRTTITFSAKKCSKKCSPTARAYKIIDSNDICFLFAYFHFPKSFDFDHSNSHFEVEPKQ